MKFSNWLNESRGQKLDLSETIEIVQKNCKQILENYKKNANYIYRGIKSTDDYIFIEPKKHVRKSANTANYYTLLFDHILPSWKKFPQRSESIICTTRRDSAASYAQGAPHIILPFDNAKIGVCPKSDIWMSFLMDMDLTEFNDNLEFYMELAGQLKSDVESNPNSLKKALEETGKFMKNNKEEIEANPDYKWYSLFYSLFMNYNGTFLQFLNNLLDPSKNNFELIKPKDNIGKFKMNEMWTESPSIMIKETKIVDFLVIHT